MARAGFDPFTLELHKRLSGSRAFAGAADPLKVILQVAVEVAIEFKRHNPQGWRNFCGTLERASAMSSEGEE